MMRLARSAFRASAVDANAPRPVRVPAGREKIQVERVAAPLRYHVKQKAITAHKNL